MGWTGWASIGLAALTSIVLIAVHWGYFKKQIEGVLETVKRHEKILSKHEEHFSDMEVHWTSRERDAQVKQLDRIEELLRDLLADRASVLSAIERMDGNSGKKKLDKA